MKSLNKKYNFTNFEDAISFINRISEIFIRENHHPKIINFYNVVELEFFTVSKNNNVTEIDYKIANEVENIFNH